MLDAINVYLQIIANAVDMLFCYPLLVIGERSIMTFGDFILIVGVFSVILTFLYSRLSK